MLVITPIYAGLLGLLFIRLSFAVIGVRRSEQVSLGDGDSGKLQKASRVHGNFAEYTPLALLLIGMLELNGAPWWLVHGLAAPLLVGRVLHAYGLGAAQQIIRFRIVGMVLTFLSLGASALANIALATHLAWIAG